MLRLYTLYAVTKIKGYGEPIKGSRYYRAFCPGCLCPVRVTQAKIENGDTIFCESCSPKNAVGTGHGGLCCVDKDPDAYKPSWKSK